MTRSLELGAYGDPLIGRQHREAILGKVSVNPQR
jgi:hypothetical protein